MVAAFLPDKKLLPELPAKRSVLFAEKLQEQILQPVPHRHFTFCIPKVLRSLFERERRLLSLVSQTAYESIRKSFQQIPHHKSPPSSRVRLAPNLRLVWRAPPRWSWLSSASSLWTFERHRRVGREAASLFFGRAHTAQFWTIVVLGGLGVPLFLEVCEARHKMHAGSVAPVLLLAGGLASAGLWYRRDR